MDTRRDEQEYPPPQSGIAPGTMADAGSGTDAESPVGGVQPAAVSSQPQQTPAEDADTEPAGAPPGAGPTPFSDTVTSSGAKEGADYSPRPPTPRPPDQHPMTDEDIIANARGARRETDPDLDVDEQQPADQSGLV